MPLSITEQVEALEDKVAAASMQVPGWKVPNKDDIDDRKFRPACLYNLGQVDLNDEYGPEATNPVEEARERLLDLEMNIERRYLKAPLGTTPHLNMQNISAKITEKNARDLDDSSNLEDSNAIPDNELPNNPDDEEEPEDNAEEKPEKTHLPRGLVMWREGVNKAQTSAQLGNYFHSLHSGMFSKVFFCCENVGRQDDFPNF